MTDDDSLTLDAILDALGSNKRRLPAEALRAATARWAEVGDTLLALMQEDADGAERDERDERRDGILFFAIYLMGQMRDTRAFRPLCRLLARGNRGDELLGDGVTEDLPVLLSRVYDGDLAPLRALIEDEAADEFTRDAGFAALSLLTATGRIDRAQTAAYLRDLHATLRPHEESYVWVGWQEAIAVLGLEELAPLVEDAFERGLIGDWVMEPKHFRDDLRKAAAAADPLALFDERMTDHGQFDDIAALMADWNSFKPEAEQERRPNRHDGWSDEYAAPPPPGTPFRNPLRNVGRNDPCPCGSGKKFKKCCLDKAA